MQNRYSDFLIDPSFQGVNKLFALSFNNDDSRESHKKYYLSTVEITDYNVMIDGRNFFDQPIKNYLKTFDKFWKIATNWWLDSKMFSRLSLSANLLQINCNRLKQTAKTKCWCESNTTN